MGFIWKKCNKIGTKYNYNWKEKTSFHDICKESDIRFKTKTVRKTTTVLLSRYIKELNPLDVKACIAIQKSQLNSLRNLQFIVW